MVNVILTDVSLEESYYLKLSEEQCRLLEWLIERDMLADVRVEKFEEYNFETI